MKRSLFAIVAALWLCSGSGCLQHQQVRCADGAACGGNHCQGLLGGLVGGCVAQGVHQTHGWRHQQPEIGPQGPPTAAYAYPYYTLHGPRDFLVDNPPSLGR